MNHIQLTGRLTADITVETKGETSRASFIIAVDRPTKDKDGKTQADFIRVTAFGKTAENAAKYVGKGNYIAVSGHINVSSYEKDGKTVTSQSNIADNIEFITWKDKDKDGKSAEPAPEPIADASDEEPW